MPRNSSGTYALPAGNPVVTNTLIQSTWANTTLSDVSTAMTDSLDRNGRGAMLAPLKNVDGTAVAPSLTFSSEGTLGIYRAAAGTLGFAVGGVLVLSLTATGLTFTTPIVLPIGSAPAPSLTFVSNTNTGIYSPATNQVAITNNGVQRVLVDASGIATFSAGVLVLGTTSNVIEASSGTGTLAFQTGGPNTRLSIDAAGAATFAGAVTITGLATLSGGVALAGGLTLSTGPLIFSAAGTNVIEASSGTGLLAFQTGGANTRLTIDAAGLITVANSLGVGGSPALGKLQVFGGAIVIDNAQSYAIKDSGGTQTAVIGLTGANVLQIGQGASVASMTFAIAAAQVGTFTSAGLFGVGATPSALISGVTSRIQASGSGATGVIAFDNGGSNNQRIAMFADSTANLAGFDNNFSTSTNGIVWRINATELMRLNSVGLGVGKTAANGYSIDAAGPLRLTPTNAAGVQVGVNLFDAGSGAAEGLAIQWESTNRVDMARVHALGNATAGGDLVFSTNAASTGSATEAMRIDASHNVGIGGSPSSRLDVQGTSIEVRIRDTTANATLRFFDSSSNSAIQSASGGLTFQTGATTRLTITAAGVISDATAEIGWKDIPQNTQTAGYTLVIGDRGKSVTITTGGVTVPTGVFSAGNVNTITNNSGTSQTITQGASVTMHQAGTTNTGNRTLLPWGICTIEWLPSNVCIITGNIT